MLSIIKNLSFSIHGGESGIAGSVEQLLSFIEGLFNPATDNAWAAIFPGLAGLANSHPLFVHFPIAFLCAFFVVDLLGSIRHKATWRQAADWFLYLGTLSAIATVIAGFIAANSLEHNESVHEIIENHEHLGLAILSLSCALSLWRWLSKGVIQDAANTLHLILSGVLVLLIVFAADLGGLLVYTHGVAVKAAPQTAGSSPHDHHSHSH